MIREPSIDPDALCVLYDESYIVSGLTDKIALASNSGFECDNEELRKLCESVIDIELLMAFRLLYGNAFFEVIESLDGTILKLEPVMNNSLRVLNGGDGYVQNIGGKTQYFNKWIPKDARDEARKVFEEIGAKENELKISEKSRRCGWNDNLNGIINFKRLSMKDKYYGDSIFEPIITQISLIGGIDGNFEAFFNRG